MRPGKCPTARIGGGDRNDAVGLTGKTELLDLFLASDNLRLSEVSGVSDTFVVVTKGCPTKVMEGPAQNVRRAGSDLRVQTNGDMPRYAPLAAPAEFTGLLWVRVRPKHTDHEFAPTPDDGHTQSPR
jgi:hypothetical protein